MKTTKVLMAIIAATITHSAIAENSGRMMPPPGPYRSMGEAGQYDPMQNAQNDFRGGEKQAYLLAQPGQQNRVVPEWLRQRQAQMRDWMKQSNRPQMQTWNNPATQWNYNQRPLMPNTYSGQVPVFQDNRMQQPFPSARGPVYGPGMPPPDFYRQSMQQAPRY